MSNRAVVAAVVVILALVPVMAPGDYWLYVLTVVGINSILAVSLHTIHRTGEISLGTGGFMAVGAYTSALLSMKLGLSVSVAMLLGGLACAVIALALGIPFMRAKGIYFGLLTLVTGEVFRLIMWYSRDLTGGQLGLNGIPSPDPINLFGITSITFDTRTSYYYLTLVVGLLCLLVLYRLQSSQVGMTWKAIRERDELAASVGINVLGYKILAFAIGCFFTGLAGALFAHFMHLLAADDTGKFSILTSIYVLIYVVVGGEGKFLGPILGAIMLSILPEAARPLKEYQPIIFGVVIMLVIFFIPQGLISLPGRFSSLRERLAKHSRAARLFRFG